MQPSIAPFALNHDILTPRFLIPSPTAATNQPPSHLRCDFQLGTIKRANRVSCWQAAARYACNTVPSVYATSLSPRGKASRVNGGKGKHTNRELAAQLCTTYQWSPARDALGMLPYHSPSLCVWSYIAPFPPASSSSQPNRRNPNPYHIPLDSPFLLALAPATSPVQSFGYHCTRFPAKAD